MYRHCVRPIVKELIYLLRVVMYRVVKGLKRFSQKLILTFNFNADYIMLVIIFDSVERKHKRHNVVFQVTFALKNIISAILS